MSTVGGGFFNTAYGSYSTVGGGRNNTSGGYMSTVGGGNNNNSSSSCTTIAGGYSNIASGYRSSVLGGQLNNTNGFNDAMIVGSNITANRNCTTFVNDLIVTSMSSCSGCAVGVSTNGLLVPIAGGGGGGVTCPETVRIAAMSGRFITSSDNIPNLQPLFAFNKTLGWSHGDYDGTIGSDANGVMDKVGRESGFSTIPLPRDLVPGDIIKICGQVLSSGKVPDNNFYIGVGYVDCSDFFTLDPIITTLIPTSQNTVDGSRVVCFSEEIVLNTILLACETMLVVGMQGGNSNQSQNEFRFTYTLDAIKYCNGPNLLIRNCCDLAYYEIIVNNGVAIGASFVDDEGFCWTVDSETESNVTGIRTKATDYTNCTDCINANPCPSNFEIQSCCSQTPQTFTAALPGVNVGDTFVDTFGLCWSVVGTNSNPITNVVFVDTVYTSTGCGEGCTGNNPCPRIWALQSCCEFRGGRLEGYTTDIILGPSYGLGDTFVDQFGICWLIKRDEGTETNIFPNLGFITPVTEYTNDNCESCTNVNECPESLFYTLQNCCTEEIEVWASTGSWSVGGVLAGGDGVNNYCYRVLSFDVVGPATITFGVFTSFSDCRDCIDQYLGGCPPTP